MTYAQSSSDITYFNTYSQGKQPHAASFLLDYTRC